MVIDNKIKDFNLHIVGYEQEIINLEFKIRCNPDYIFIGEWISEIESLQCDIEVLKEVKIGSLYPESITRPKRK